MMEADRIALCGPKGVSDASRRAVRGGPTASQVVPGGQRIAGRRPRVPEGAQPIGDYGQGQRHSP